MINYYVSSTIGSDSNDGRSEETPFKTLAKLLSVDYCGNIVFNLKRGDIWYECLQVNENAPHLNSLVIQPYGEGDMPTIRNCYILKSNAITNVTGNIYTIDMSLCGGSSSSLYNIGFIYNKLKDKVYANKQSNISDLSYNFDFYSSDNLLYIYSDIDISNMELYFAYNETGIKDLQHNTIVKNLKIELCGGHGIVTTNTGIGATNIIIEKCEIDLIGGSYLSGTTRYGNGFQSFRGINGLKFRKNKVKRCYDCGFTLQGSDAIWKNVDVYLNVFEENGQSVEVWNTGSSTDTTLGVFNFKFRKNICINNGNGWSKNITTRNVEMLFYNLQLYNLNYEIHDNIFFNPKVLYHWTNLDTRFKSFNNKIFMIDGAKLLDEGMYTTNDFETFRSDTLKENNSELIIIPETTSNLQRILNNQLINSLFNHEKSNLFNEECQYYNNNDNFFQLKSTGGTANQYINFAQIQLKNDHSSVMYEFDLYELEKLTFEHAKIKIGVGGNDISSAISVKLSIIPSNLSSTLINASNIFTTTNLSTGVVSLWIKCTDVYMTISGKCEVVGNRNSGRYQALKMVDIRTTIDPR